MTFDWTISHNNSLNPRARRHHVTMNLSVTIAFESWQIMWPMKLANLSTSGLLAEFPVANPRDAGNANDLLKLLEAEPNVCLQLDSCSLELLPASIDAVFVRSEKTSRGLELAFCYDERSEDIQQIFTNILEQPIQ